MAFVSSIDTGLTVHFRETLLQLEQNPIARNILSSDEWKISLFITLKMFCTILALGILVHVFKKDAKSGLLVACSLAAFQAALLMYLLL